MPRFIRPTKRKNFLRVGSPRPLTYPGVYIKEIASAIRPISGQPTSKTAFIGRAKRGPTNIPTEITSFADFEHRFGNLWEESQLGYSVRDYLLNGGTRAIIVRLTANATCATLHFPIAELDGVIVTCRAHNPGIWGQQITATIDHLNLIPGDTEHFNLQIERADDGYMEKHIRLSLDPNSARFVGTILEARSQLLVLDDSISFPSEATNFRPAPGTYSPEPNTGSDGSGLGLSDFVGSGHQTNQEGLYVLEKADLFNLLVIPPYTTDDQVHPALIDEAAVYCERRRAFYIVDSPPNWGSAQQAKTGIDDVGTASVNAAIYYPRMEQTDPLDSSSQVTRAPSGAIAGVFASTDNRRGVWKAPAGLDAQLRGFTGPEFNLDTHWAGELNRHHINPIQRLTGRGTVLYGSRTLGGKNSPDWKYIAVRRLALHMEESIERGTAWAVFETNQQPLWNSIRQSVENFLQSLWRQGAFPGSKPEEAFFVRCGLGQTMTQQDLSDGRLVYQVGFAPLKPAEFIVLTFQMRLGGH